MCVRGALASDDDALVRFMYVRVSAYVLRISPFRVFYVARFELPACAHGRERGSTPVFLKARPTLPDL